MDRGTAPFLLLAMLAGLLLAAGIEDARRRQIANRTNAAIALLAPIWWWANGLAPWPDMAAQLLVASIAFAVFVGAFVAGWMGGGDVKMIGALALWLSPAALLQMLMTMSLIGGGITVVMLAERRLRAAGGPEEPRPVEVPYGIAIAAAGLLSLREPLLNHLT
jgi:prepilin peptidase CpaA